MSHEAVVPVADPRPQHHRRIRRQRLPDDRGGHASIRGKLYLKIGQRRTALLVHQLHRLRQIGHISAVQTFAVHHDGVHGPVVGLQIEAAAQYMFEGKSTTHPVFDPIGDLRPCRLGQVNGEGVGVIVHRQRAVLRQVQRVSTRAAPRPRECYAVRDSASDCAVKRINLLRFLIARNVVIIHRYFQRIQLFVIGIPLQRVELVDSPTLQRESNIRVLDHKLRRRTSQRNRVLPRLRDGGLYAVIGHAHRIGGGGVCVGVHAGNDRCDRLRRRTLIPCVLDIAALRGGDRHLQRFSGSVLIICYPFGKVLCEGRCGGLLFKVELVGLAAAQ